MSASDADRPSDRVSIVASGTRYGRAEPKVSVRTKCGPRSPERLGCAFAHDHPRTVTTFPLAISLRTGAALDYISGDYGAAGLPLPGPDPPADIRTVIELLVIPARASDVVVASL